MGAGARAAYQVGALAALARIAPGPTPFRILCGVSAGAINAAALATHAEDFPAAVERLRETWLGLKPGRIYRTDARRLVSIGGRWMRDLSSGGLVRRRPINFLLDATPLREMLADGNADVREQAVQALGEIRDRSALVTAFVVPNSVYSKDLTEAAKKSAREAVLPVNEEYKEGESIVQRGQILTAAQIEALQKFGLINVTDP